jgi:hypothetical protein
VRRGRSRLAAPSARSGSCLPCRVAPKGGDGAPHPGHRAGAALWVAPLGVYLLSFVPASVATALLAAALARPPASGRARRRGVPGAWRVQRAVRAVAGRHVRRRVLPLLHGMPRRSRGAARGRRTHGVLPPDRPWRRAADCSGIAAPLLSSHLVELPAGPSVGLGGLLAILNLAEAWAPRATGRHRALALRARVMSCTWSTAAGTRGYRLTRSFYGRSACGTTGRVDETARARSSMAAPSTESSGSIHRGGGCPRLTTARRPASAARWRACRAIGRGASA